MGRLRVGVALGSGGAKGFAHIGVLSALADHDIPIAAVAGSSMGSLVGACYAMGVSPRMMRGLALSLRRRHFLDFTVPKMGLIAGERVRELVRLLTRDARIEETRMPLAIVATDLIARELVVFRSGSIADAVRASISIPGAFVPVVREGAVYVDGGVLERVPVRAAWDLGCDRVIGVDVGITPRGFMPKSMADVMMQSLELMQDRAGVHKTPTASITLVPNVSHIGTAQFTRAKEAIAAGYAVTVERLAEIRAVVAETSTDVQSDASLS